MKRSLATLVVAAVIISACAITSREATTDLPGSSWVLVEIDGEAPAADPPPTLAFNEDGTVTGSAGCNTFNGSVAIDGSALEFGPLATTRMACADPAIGEQETALLQALQATTGYTIDDEGRLVLTGGDAELIFEVAGEGG